MPDVQSLHRAHGDVLTGVSEGTTRVNPPRSRQLTVCRNGIAALPAG